MLAANPGVTSLNQLPGNRLDMERHLADTEISLIEQALSKTNQLVARVATMLNMRRTTLYRKEARRRRRNFAEGLIASAITMARVSNPGSVAPACRAGLVEPLDSLQACMYPVI